MNQLTDFIKSLTKTGTQCVYCGREIADGTLLCAACGKEERVLGETDGLEGGVLHVFRYDGIVRQLIHRYKYDDQPRLAFFIAQRMAEFLEGYEVAADLVTFVPIHENRLRIRGFDQAEMIAAHLSVLIDLPFMRLLERVVDTKPQFDLSGKERAANVRGAFACVPGIRIMGRNILVVDDIYTTGATMGQCIRCLTDAGANAVPFVFSREY